jgi:DNA polymerase I-like protein with 3'-5' exonuclease and polymerase domains
MGKKPEGGKDMAKHKEKPPVEWKITVDGIVPLRDPVTACNQLGKDKVIGVDLETTGLSPWKNDIALIQLYGEQTGTLAVLQVRNGELPVCISHLLASGKKFIVHNGVGFDLLFLDQQMVDWKRSTWHDTLVGETLLATSGRRDVRKNLQSSLRRRLGKEIDKDIEHGHWGDNNLTDEQIKYAAQDVISLPALYRSQLEKGKESKQDEALQMEMDLVPIVVQMTANGLPCTKKRMQEYIVKQKDEIEASGKRLHKLFGSINFRSTKQLQEALAKQGIQVRSTNKETLLEISQFGGKAGKIVDDLMQWKHGDQRIKMYNEEWMDEHIINGRVHPHFWQCSADTTRFTCSNPNLQQIPKDSRSDIIGGLEGWRMVSCDYSQIEVRIAAFIAHDAVLMKLLEKGDVHTAVAAAVFQCKETDVTPKQRKLAKAMTFLLLFGGGVSGFYNYVTMSGGQITEEEAGKYVTQFFATFSGLRAMREYAENLSRKYGPVFIRLPNGSRRMLVGWNKKSTTILNTMVQGTAAVGIKYGMLEADAQGLTKYLGGQIHDELLATVPMKEAKEYGRELEQAMVKGMKRILTSSLVKAEVKIGKDWLA